LLLEITDRAGFYNSEALEFVQETNGMDDLVGLRNGSERGRF